MASSLQKPAALQDQAAALQSAVPAAAAQAGPVQKPVAAQDAPVQPAAPPLSSLKPQPAPRAALITQAAAVPQAAVPQADEHRLSDASRSQLARADAVAMEWIGDVLQTAFAAEPSVGAAPGLAAATRQLLLRAWTLARQLGHRKVMLDHVIAALAASSGPAQERLAAQAGGDPNAPLAGALLRLAVQEVQAPEPSIEAIGVHDDVLRWIGEAGRVAASRPEGQRQVVPDDFLVALQARDQDGHPAVRNKVKALLRLAARTGRAQTQLEKARQHIESLGKSVSFYRSQTNQQIGSVSGSLKGLDTRVGELSKAVDRDLIGQTKALRQQLTSISQHIEAMRGELAKTPGASGGPDAARAVELASFVDECRAQIGKIDNRLGAIDPARVAALSQFTQECREQLSALDRRIVDVQGRLPPRPPSVLPMLLAITAVIAIGATAGLVLAQASAGPVDWSAWWPVLPR